MVLAECLAPEGGLSGHPMSSGEEAAAQGLIKRQFQVCGRGDGTGCRASQVRHTTQDKCAAEAARLAARHAARAVLAAA
jgi:hypothetical protein